MWLNPQFPAVLVRFTEEILNGKLHFLCRVKHLRWNYFYVKTSIFSIHLCMGMVEMKIRWFSGNLVGLWKVNACDRNPWLKKICSSVKQLIQARTNKKLFFFWEGHYWQVDQKRSKYLLGMPWQIKMLNIRKNNW